MQQRTEEPELTAAMLSQLMDEPDEPQEWEAHAGGVLSQIPYLPSPSAIRAECLAIQIGWDADTELLRRATGVNRDWSPMPEFPELDW